MVLFTLHTAVFVCCGSVHSPYCCLCLLWFCSLSILLSLSVVVLFTLHTAVCVCCGSGSLSILLSVSVAEDLVHSPYCCLCLLLWIWFTLHTAVCVCCGSGSLSILLSVSVVVLVHSPYCCLCLLWFWFTLHTAVCVCCCGSGSLSILLSLSAAVILLHSLSRSVTGVSHRIKIITFQGPAVTDRAVG